MGAMHMTMRMIVAVGMAVPLVVLMVVMWVFVLMAVVVMRVGWFVEIDHIHVTAYDAVFFHTSDLYAPIGKILFLRKPLEVIVCLQQSAKSSEEHVS